MVKSRGQSTLEVTILTCIVVGAFLSMYLYLKMSVQGNWKSNADSFSDKQFSGNFEKVSNPGVSDSGVYYQSTNMGLDVDGDREADVRASNLNKYVADPKNGRIEFDRWGKMP